MQTLTSLIILAVLLCRFISILFCSRRNVGESDRILTLPIWYLALVVLLAWRAKVVFRFFTCTSWAWGFSLVPLCMVSSSWTSLWRLISLLPNSRLTRLFARGLFLSAFPWILPLLAYIPVIAAFTLMIVFMANFVRVRRLNRLCFSVVFLWVSSISKLILLFLEIPQNALDSVFQHVLWIFLAGMRFSSFLKSPCLGRGFLFHAWGYSGHTQKKLTWR